MLKVAYTAIVIKTWTQNDHKVLTNTRKFVKTYSKVFKLPVLGLKVIKKVLKSSKVGQQLEHQRQLSLEHFHTTLITDLAISCQFVSIFRQS